MTSTFEVRKPTKTEKELVDIATEMVITYHANRKHFKKMSNEEVAAWIRKQLSGCGYIAEPMGMNWASLIQVQGKG